MNTRAYGAELLGTFLFFAIGLISVQAVGALGASVNPARSIGPTLVVGPTLVGGDLSSLWIYLVAPILGAVVAALVHRVMNTEPQPRPAA